MSIIAVPSQDDRVAVEIVFMSFKLRANAKAMADVRIDIVVVMVVMATKIILHSVAGVGEEVVVRLVVAGAVIVVDGLLAVVVCDHEVVVDVIVLLVW